jgi:alpha-glucosidase
MKVLRECATPPHNFILQTTSLSGGGSGSSSPGNYNSKNHKIIMKNMQNFLVYCLISFSVFNISAQNKAYVLHSPDQRLKLEINQADKLSFTVSDDIGLVVTASEISLKLADGSSLVTGDKIRKVSKSEVNQSVGSPFYKKAFVQVNYKQLRLAYKDYAVVFRAYNDGVAYRFETSKKQDFIVENEIADFQFEKDNPLFAPYVRPREKGKSIQFERQFFSSFENIYTHAPLSSFNPDSLLLLPLMADAGQGRKLLFTEVNLENYPGMYLNRPAGTRQLSAVFAPYPKKEVQGAHNMLQMLVEERENYIADRKSVV